MHEHERRRVTRSVSGPAVVRLELKNGLGNQRWVTADLIDSCQDGIGVFLAAPLIPETTITARGGFQGSMADGGLRVRVVWCQETDPGKFRAGFQLVPDAQRPSGLPRREASIDPEDFDCYEILQLSPNADRETIERVYRILAQRYHPDNCDTGNAERFIRLTKAYRLLDDAESRAGYDARHQRMRLLRWQLFDPAAASGGPDAEKQKRQSILSLLYSRALQDPEGAGLSIHAFEELLGCPREHLNSALWYLKGKAHICRGDNGRFNITISGFEEAEKYEVSAPLSERLLPQASNNTL